MFNASVWLYLKPNAAESQRPCWMAGTWNQLRGRGKPARFHLCLSKGYTTNQAPGKRAPLSSVKHRKKEAGTSLLNHIKLHWSQQVTRKDNLTKGFFFSPSFKPFKLFKWNLITNKQLSCPFWGNNPDTCAILHTQKCQPDTAFFLLILPIFFLFLSFFSVQFQTCLKQLISSGKQRPPSNVQKN